MTYKAAIYAIAKYDFDHMYDKYPSSLNAETALEIGFGLSQEQVEEDVRKALAKLLEERDKK